MKATLDAVGVVEQDSSLRQAAGAGFLQHLEVHLARLEITRQPTAAHG